LRNISHEIRTPLSAIIGLVELLGAHDGAEERRQELLLRVLSNSRVLLALVDDLLDLAKVEAGRLHFEPVAVAPLEIVAETVANLENEAHRKGLRLSIETVGALTEVISTDPKRLRQILTNLVGNAIKFTERGTVTVRIGGGARAPQLVIDVADTGIGLTAAQAAGLFAPFRQGDGSIALRFGGSGLGLALSRRLAEGMGGTLEIATSAPGVGTTFRVVLPATAAAAPPSPPRKASRAPSGRELAGMRLLLAEDNRDIRETIMELLQLCGAEVVEAEDGLAAVRLAQSGTFDLILMDVRMPGVDGLEATRRLRSEGARMPIVALTADAVEEHRQVCLAAGCDDRVTKPIELAHLVDVVRGFVHARRDAGA
jgi:CheY-like chemotaxis protein